MNPSDIALTVMELSDADDNDDRAGIIARALGKGDDSAARQFLARALEAVHKEGKKEGRKDGIEAAREYIDSALDNLSEDD